MPPIFLVLLFCRAFANQVEPEHLGFPHHISKVHIRNDLKGKPVSRGQIYKLGGLENISWEKRVSLSELREVLQCAPDEPDLNGRRGTLDLIRLSRPTKETVKLMATWAETGCTPWTKCHELMPKIEKKLDGYGTPSMSGGVSCWSSHVRMLRVINNSLYHDWPFDNLARFGKKENWIEKRNFFLHHLLLGKVNNLGDSVFFFGEEQAYMPYTFPFFAFSSSPTFKHADMPWPWKAHQREEYSLYKEYESLSRSSGDYNATILGLERHADIYNNMSSEQTWMKKRGKAAFYGTLSQIRHIFFDVALANPKLYDVGWNGGLNTNIWAWNPSDPAAPAEFEFYNRTKLATGATLSLEPGYLDSLLHQYRNNDPVTLFQTSKSLMDPATMYKYIVILIGSIDTASADRLAATMLLHSGAVILLQGHEFEYHFGSRLKPWVHYVPLSYTAADVASKVRWLQRNDHLARNLAHNARAFALSYLRLEDMVCYAASALSEASALAKPSALEPFEPIPIEPCLCP